MISDVTHREPGDVPSAWFFKVSQSFQKNVHILKTRCTTIISIAPDPLVLLIKMTEVH